MNLPSLSSPKAKRLPKSQGKFLPSATRFGHTGCFFPDHIPVISGPDIKVYSNGTLDISTVSKDRDKGLYSCTARNGKGERAEGSAAIDVIGKTLDSIVIHKDVLKRKGVITMFKWLTSGPPDPPVHRARGASAGRPPFTHLLSVERQSAADH